MPIPTDPPRCETCKWFDREDLRIQVTQYPTIQRFTTDPTGELVVTPIDPAEVKGFCHWDPPVRPVPQTNFGFCHNHEEVLGE